MKCYEICQTSNTTKSLFELSGTIFFPEFWLTSLCSIFPTQLEYFTKNDKYIITFHSRQADTLFCRLYHYTSRWRQEIRFMSELLQSFTKSICSKILFIKEQNSCYHYYIFGVSHWIIRSNSLFKTLIHLFIWIKQVYLHLSESLNSVYSKSYYCVLLWDLSHLAQGLRDAHYGMPTIER